MKRRGIFVTFEGIEGSGKSTQIRRLASWLRGHDIPVVVTREPGGTRAGDAIRTIFLGPAGRGLDPWAELFLVEAARAQHLEEVVRPALAAGRVVLCDRFTDSTLAYQGSGRGLAQPVIRRLHRLPALRPMPDLTILLDLPVAEGLARASGRNASVRRTGKGRASDTRIDEVMECAPQTYRPHRLVEEITARMRKKEVDSILVTTSDGELLGVFYRSPPAAPA